METVPNLWLDFHWHHDGGFCMATDSPIHRVRWATAHFVLCLGLTACAARSGPSDAVLVRHVPEDASLEMSVSGDADGDGDADALIVVGHAPGHDSVPRGLLILRRGPDGSLTKAAYGPKAIFCRTCGEMMEDPLQSVSVENGEFALRFEGGSRELWSSEYRFRYVPARKRWHLNQIMHRGMDRFTGMSAQRRLIAPSLEEVSLEFFDPADYPADAIP
jgi:hypothetical protein